MTSPTTPAPTSHQAQAPAAEGLRKVLGLPAAVMFGLAYMMPLASFTTYGVVNTMTEGHVVTSYWITLVAMLFTAASYAAMAGAYSATGGAYTYTRRTLGGHVGFLGGWTILLDYVLLPMMAYLVIGVYLHQSFPAVPQGVWIAGSIALVTVLNMVGITMLSKVSSAIVLAQTVFLVLFALLAVRTARGQEIPSLWDALAGRGPGTATALAGAAILCYSFLGFDSVASLAEETRNARRTIPRAILLVTLLGGLLFIAVSLVSSLAVPHWQNYTSVDAASLDVVRAVGGKLFESFFTAAFVAGCFGAVLAQQATVSRVLFSMGRDGVLPRRVFGHLHPVWRTPVCATLVVSAIGLVSLFVDLTLASSLINFGALTAFSLVNIATVKHYVIDGKRRGAGPILRYLVAPVIGLALSVWLWTSLSEQAFVIGLCWLGVGLVHLVAMTRGFRVAPPDLDMAEA
ncbi:APC family permease [Streptomyces sp. NPDC002405]|uniref:APC family permease n=1 Tax=unclassified Streptomyces TaxID=2593676 RepID=UPI0036A193F3